MNVKTSASTPNLPLSPLPQPSGNSRASKEKLIDERIESEVRREHAGPTDQARNSGALDGRTYFVDKGIREEVERRKNDPKERTKAWDHAVDAEIDRQVAKETAGSGLVDGRGQREAQRRKADPEERAKAAKSLADGQDGKDFVESKRRLFEDRMERESRSFLPPGPRRGLPHQQPDQARPQLLLLSNVRA
ncbi:MAG: hypothetical protein HYV07_22810 [Deltaproteobacteria bacterium]|nr:hypothetical protein [Deltaproteobacteria bacterium]